LPFPLPQQQPAKLELLQTLFLKLKGLLCMPLLSYRVRNNLEPDLLSTRWSWIQSEGLGDCFSPFPAGQPTELELLQTHFWKLKGLQCMLLHRPRSSEIIWNHIHDCSPTERPWTKALGGRPRIFPAAPIEAWKKTNFRLMHSGNHAIKNSETPQNDLLPSK
jgi:hypothetical protein